MLGLSSSSHPSPKRISLQEAANNGLVDISSKGGYIGDKVRFDPITSQHPRLEIAMVVGDILVNKTRANQNLVLGKVIAPPDLSGRIKEGIFNGKKAYIITVRKGEKLILEGGCTFCIDARKSAPKLGDKFDVGPNLCDFNSHPNVSRLLSLVQLADEKNLYNETTQKAVWFYTDPDKYGQPTDSSVNELIKDSGGNPDIPEPGFPHLSNPNKDSPETRAVIPPEANSINLSWQGRSREVNIGFVHPDLIWQSSITVPLDANLSVAVKDIGIEGDIWVATIYEKTGEHLELMAESIGDGSKAHYSKAAKAEIASGVALLAVRYIEGVDKWPAGMSVKLWIDSVE